MASKLDQIVKGAVASPPPISTAPSGVADPTLNLPSSPPQIYLNLLILEASLRAQYLELLARRRQHTFFLTLLALWTCYFGYALFFAPREDGSGVGGSVYWVVEVTERVCFMGGVVTGLLVWGTGQWERGIRWPRRFVGVTNRGLRGFNCKIVVVRGPWWKEWLSTLKFYSSGGLWANNGSSSYRYIPPSLSANNPTSTPPVSNRNSVHGLPNIKEGSPALSFNSGQACEEDLSPGGDKIALLLLPKPFSSTFRENWDTYRTEYWERENERRAQLRQKLREYDRALAKRQSWWKRWFWRTPRASARDIEKSLGHTHSQSHGHPHRHSHLGIPAEKEKMLRREGSLRSGSHSRTSSRSSTPAPSSRDEEAVSGGGHSRRSSTASNASRKKRSGTNSGLTPSGSVKLRELRPAHSKSSLGASSGDDQDVAVNDSLKGQKDIAASLGKDGVGEDTPGSNKSQPRVTEDERPGTADSLRSYSG
jgi:hypothetical protein